MKYLERTLLYAGLDIEEFNALKDDAIAETRRALQLYSMFATFLFIIMAVFERTTNGSFVQNIGIYFAMAVICAFVWFLSHRVVPKHRDLVLPLAYLLVTTMYVFALTLTMLHTDLPAVTFVAMLVLAKPQEIAMGDEWNSITLCAVSIGAAVFQRKLRFRALAQARQIRYLSETDLLTGAKNRNSYEQESMKYADSCRHSLTCVFADVNGLHEMNDTKGHKAGDVMLQTVAKALLDRFGSEHVYRVGGDEFVAFAPDEPEDGVKQDIRRISDELAAVGYDISVGIITGEKGNMDLPQMLGDAEKEMYRQKTVYYQQPGHERRHR